MLSIVITAFKEPKTIGKAIESFVKQDIKERYELIISAPDEETLNIAKEYKKKYKYVKCFKDPGKGKSYASNLLLPKLKGDIIFFTDGDVYVSKKSVNEILKEFKKSEKIGCVTGRPVSVEDKKTKYGYWANFLFDSAHKQRKKLKEKGKFMACSGYLLAFKGKIIREFPLNTADDGIIPYLFWNKGYRISYAEKSLVYVKNTSNWIEWVSQKIRTARAHETLDKYMGKRKATRNKTFLNELKGIICLFRCPKSAKEFYWSIQLMFARLYIWMKVFTDVYIKRKYHKDAWERVESTK